LAIASEFAAAVAAIIRARQVMRRAGFFRCADATGTVLADIDRAVNAAIRDGLRYSNALSHADLTATYSLVSDSVAK
jgi:hypothetical protein